VEEARNHGFPDFDFEMELLGKSWDSSVYAGLRQFHQAKGFDPFTQDVAMELGYSLVSLSGRQDASFGHGKYAELSVMLIYSDVVQWMEVAWPNITLTRVKIRTMTTCLTSVTHDTVRRLDSLVVLLLTG
jgi:hypothetical protein